MATSSVASLPARQHTPEDPDAPAMLGRARSLAAGKTSDRPGSTHSYSLSNGVSTRGAAVTARLDTRDFLAMSRTKPSHRHTHSGRISKTRVRPSPIATPSPVSSSSSLQSLTGKSTAATPMLSPAAKNGSILPTSATPSGSSANSNSAAHLALGSPSPPDTDAPVLSFWGPEPVPLPSRFARIKQNLIAGHEAEIEASWARLITALKQDVDHIEGLGAHLIPSVEFADLEDESQTARFGRDLRRYGVGVIRRVVPRADADDVVKDTVRYFDERHQMINPGGQAGGRSVVDARAPEQDPTCFDLFWTPAQVRCRAHPNMLRAQRFMMGLWETSPDDRLATRLPITYVDRIRIHGTGFDKDSGGKDRGVAIDSAIAPQRSSSSPQSADDWVIALQSSAGIMAQVDNGSLERWEPDGYGRAGTYEQIFHGRWEDYDPWECDSRVSSTIDLYNGHGSCTIFRMFQGLLALSTIEPGMVRLLPSPKLAAAYYLLRPFFSPKQPAPAPGPPRGGPEWEAYLAPENWALQRDPDTIIHGAVPGHAQRITEHWHPHLHLRGSMITLPTLQPGDYICWHPDLPYHISSTSPGLTTPSSPGASDISMLVYIPAAPLTQTNALYLARQRKAFQRGCPGPDFDTAGRGVIPEDPAHRPGEREIAEAGGPAALRAMGLAPWEVAETRAGSPPPAVPAAAPATTSRHEETHKSKDGRDEEMRDVDAAVRSDGLMKGLDSPMSISKAEAEVVRIANLILFPDHEMV